MTGLAAIVLILNVHLTVERTFIDWSDPRGRIVREIVCERDLKLPVSDVRGHAEDRPGIPLLETACSSFYLREPVEIMVFGRGEWLRPRDMDGWIGGERDLSRIFFSLHVVPRAGSTVGSRLQSYAGFESFSENLNPSHTAFRLSPPEFLRVVCNATACQSAGPEAIFRAHVEIRPAID